MAVKIILGHSNMDLDCIGSMVLARYLFPDHIPVGSHLIHPVAKNLVNLFKDRLSFASPAELKGWDIRHVVVVDTRARDRIDEFVRNMTAPEAAVWEVFDHHPSDGNDVSAAVMHETFAGANASQLALELMSRGITPAAEDATIALTGIYADTGNFTHENVSGDDFTAAAWLLSQGASLSMVRDFLVPLREKHQVELFHEALNRLDKRSVRGHEIHVCSLEPEDDAQGLGAVVEQAFNVENAEILMGFFFFRRKKKILVIGRNRNPELDLNAVLSPFGGGGHRQAASATIRTEDGEFVTERILGLLEELLVPAATAADIMTRDVVSIAPDSTLVEASKLMESVSHTGVPVVTEAGDLVGILTLRDIMVGRRANQMHVRAERFMSGPPVTAEPGTTVQAVEELLFRHNIGHLPILDGRRLAGIITRTDILRFKRGDKSRRNVILYGLEPART